VKHVLQIVFFVLVLTAVGQALWQHDRLPPKVAAHFGTSGRADGWLARDTQTTWHIATVLFLAAIIQGVALVHARLPKEYINLPQRDYWLAPERAAATRDWITGAVLFIGCGLLVFFLVLFHLVYRANLDPTPRLSGAVWWLTGGLLGLIAGVTTTLLVKFRRKPSA